MNSTDLMEVIDNQKGQFTAMNAANLNFATEVMFAKQILANNDKVKAAALQRPNLLAAAMQNVAAIGLTLSPAHQWAYLVPRDGRICLDISYRGMLKLATDTGVIKWARADLVYENDNFVYRGPAEAPVIETDPFLSDRGAIKGAFCIAKTVDGDILTEVMNMEQLNKVRDSSKAKNGPWKTWPEEMMKKTVIKRAAKTWPQSDGRARFDHAIEVVNQHEGLAEPEVHTLIDDDRYREFVRTVKETDPVGHAALKHLVDIEEWVAMHRAYLDGNAPRGAKGDWRTMLDELLVEGQHAAQEAADAIVEQCNDEDISFALEALHEHPANAQAYLMTLMPQGAQVMLEQADHE